MTLRRFAVVLLVGLSSCDAPDVLQPPTPPTTREAAASGARLDAVFDAARPVHPAVGWARVVAPFDRIATPPIRAVRRGDMQLSSQVEPVALAGDARGALLYLAMDGITLQPCADGEIANSAKSCTSMVDELTEFPAYGNAAQRAALAQQVAAYYEPYDVTVTTARPPEYMPYTLQAIGGAPALIDQTGICGLGHLECGATARNRVGVVFPEGDGCTPSKTAAHEAGHNFGLEHTIDADDIMSYTLVYDGFYAFRDACMPLFHETEDESAACPLTHAKFCPDGEQQNSHGELLATMGPRRSDALAPQVEVEPADGSVFTTDDTIIVAANVVEDGNFVGARWTWVGGLPEELPFGHDRCTNDACTEPFANILGDPSSPWDYLVLQGPPVGEYLFVFEVMDTSGNETVVDVAFTVVDPPAAGGDDGGASSSGSSESGDASDGDSSESGSPSPEAPPSEDALPAGFGGNGADASGCTVARTTTPAWCWVVIPLFAWRQRRIARRGRA